MPHCYLLAVAFASALDRDSNNWSLFNLTEQVQLPPDAPPPGPSVGLPLEIHCYWLFSDAELNQDFEWRLIVGAGGQEARIAAPFPLRSDKRRQRIRTKGLPFLFEGETIVQVEWCERGTANWKREDALWPLLIERPVKVAQA
jgi:hypothetical protein